MKLKNLILFPALALILSGCGYTVKSSLPENIQTVAVLVKNESSEPSIEVEVTKALQAEIQMDGRLRLVTSGNADAILNVTLYKYNLIPVAFDRRRGERAREYRVELHGRAVLSDANTGEVIFEAPTVRGEADFIYAADVTTSKMMALPKVAAEFARKTVSHTVTAW